MATAEDILALAKKANQAGDLERAEGLYRQVLRAQPAHAHAWYLLGAMYQSMNRLDESVDSLRQALRLNPAYAHAHHHLGVTLAKQENFVEAVACFREALRLEPRLVEAHRNLGTALNNLGRPAEAIVVLEQALRLKPDFAEAHLALAGAPVLRGRIDEALASCRQAVQHKPAHVPAYLELGTILKRLGRAEESRAVLEQALRLQADSANAQNLLGVVCLDTGDFEKAIDHYHAALRLQPGFPAAYHHLGRVARQGKYHFSDAEIDQVRRLLAETGNSLEDQSILHFALAHALDNRGAFDQSFAHFLQGNDCIRRSQERRQSAFNIESHRRAFDEQIATFDQAFFARVAPLGQPSELPVFIVGMPRSGTTLVEQILSCHARFAGAGELLEMQNIKFDLPGVLNVPEKYPACLAKLNREAVRSLAERYLRRLEREDPQALRVSDKLPENYFHLGLIAALFPRARIIHCRRDPRDTCVSCFCEHFEGVPFASSLENLGHYYVQYERLMAHWRKVLPLALFEVQYEELVANQEALSRRLVAFCGLDWDDRCLAFHKSRRMVQTASNVQVRQPIYTSSVGRWRRYQAHLGPLLELLKPFLPAG